MKKRTDIWNDIKAKEACEVLILGGGVNGAGLMRELAAQGISCVLVDKDDFAAGASSKSSRMIHGGLRYLENADFDLVRESVSERNRLLRCASHFVRPLKTCIPLDSWLTGAIKSPLVFFGLPITVRGRGAFIVKMGLSFYDFITRKRRQTPKHYFMSKSKSMREIPGLRENIACTAVYWDAWVSQIERLCVEMVQEAVEENGACAAINYVTAAKRGEDGVVLTDQESGEETVLRPRIVVNATGAWVDFANRTLGVESQFMGGTKGSHLVIDNKELYKALGDKMVYYEHHDGRICITFQFMDKVIMGSTDISVENPDKAMCEDDEIDYMMTTLKGVFPKLNISKEDIVFIFCGVRPLLSSNIENTNQVTRSHRIEVSEPDDVRRFRIYSMIGGKLTTFGAFAEQTTDMILKELGKSRAVSIDERPYLGARYGGANELVTDEKVQQEWVARVARENDLAKERVAVLVDRYGTVAEKIASVSDREKHRLLTQLPDYSVSEIEFIAENECVQLLSDIVRRRSIITLLGQADEAALTEVAAIAGEILDWDEERQKAEVEWALEEAGDRK